MKNLEIIETYVKPRPTMKQILKERSGRSVPGDYFLFRCFEERQLRRKSPQRFGKIAWPKLKEKDAKWVEESFFDNLIEVLSFHAAPANGGGIIVGEVLDFTSVGLFVPAVIDLLEDIEKLVRLSYDRELPVYSEQDPLWISIHKAFSETAGFQHTSNWFFQYMKWAFSDESSKPYDLSLVPPIGRFIPMIKKYVAKRLKGQSSSREYQQQEAPPHRESPRPKPIREARHEKPRKERGGFNKEKPHHKGEDEALNDVLEGIKTLESTPNLVSVQLPPQNSYMRRMQHQEVVRLGYQSESIGDGESRAVMILKKS